MISSFSAAISFSIDSMLKPLLPSMNCERWLCETSVSFANEYRLLPLFLMARRIWSYTDSTQQILLIVNLK